MAADAWASRKPQVSDQPCVASAMKVIAIIQDPDEIKKILAHLVKVGRSPPGFDPADLS